jgi:proline iminopeptidase
VAELYPEIEPYEHGMLEVGDGQQVYWEVCGNRDGKPAVVLHGGPGSGCSPWLRRLFDPDRYRVVLFDQRGCGRSRPHAADPSTDLSVNTTRHLLGDIERLLGHLGIDRWLVFGGSWGTVLGLAYAQRHPERVTELVLAAVGTGTRMEVDWMTRRVGRLFPEEWARFRDGVPAADRDGDLASAYARLLNDPDPAVREQAARDWCAWEDAHVDIRPAHRHNPRYDDPTFRMVFARLVTHYWSNAHFLPDGILLQEAARLAGIPGAMIHGRLDVSGPPDIAWQLARAWPDAELTLIDEAPHSAGHPATAAAIVRATDRFATRR